MTAETLSCHDVVKELWDYLDSEVAPERWEAIREHLATCAGCHAHVEFCRTFLAKVDATSIAEAEVAVTRTRIESLLRAERIG
jgi:anti-sigma factor RsiW